MYRKIAIAGATAVVIIGSGTAALAASGSATPGSPSSAPSSAGSKAPAAKSAKGHALLRRTVHGQVVTRNKDGQFVTHDITRGDVTAVSSSALTVKSADGTSQAYKVTASTKVRVRTSGQGAAGKITDVHVGDAVLVTGTGTGTPTATHVVDVKK
jgi:hypothetical protein